MPEDKPPTSSPREPEGSRPPRRKEAPPETPAARPAETAAGPAETTGRETTEENNKERIAPGAPLSEGVATEKPVMTALPPPTSTYVVTVENRTGVAIKVERLNEQTGERRELGRQEYARLFPYARPRPAAAPRTGAASARTLAVGMSAAAPPAPPEAAALAEAYYRGVADYIKAVTGWG